MLSHATIELEPYKITVKANERFVVSDPEALVDGSYIYIFDGFLWEKVNSIQANPDLFKKIIELGGATSMESLLAAYLSLFSNIDNLKENLTSLYSSDSYTNIEQIFRSPKIVENLLTTFQRLKGLNLRFVYKISADEFVLFAEPDWVEGSNGMKLLPFLIREIDGKYFLVAGNSATKTPKWQNIMSTFIQFGIGKEILVRVRP